MRKLIVLSFITLDGVMQAPGGPEEDTSGGFKYGGWSFPLSDEVTGAEMMEQLGHDFELLLGRKTYNIFAAYWPTASVDNFVAEPFNRTRKYVATHSPLTLEWANSHRIEGDVVEGVRKLKAQDGPELQVHGSGNFIQTLLKNDLVDELWLKIFPLTLGPGKRLFEDGAIPAVFELTKSMISPKGVIFANYRRAGEVGTGSFA